MNTNRKTTVRAILGIVLVVILIGLVFFYVRQRQSTPQSYTRSTVAMGTVISQTLYTDDDTLADETASAIDDKVNWLDAKALSWRKEDSDIWTLNKEGSATVNAITAECLSQCLELAKKTDGRFDPTVGALSTLWQIGTEDARVPSEDEIESAKERVDYTNVSVDGDTVTIGDGQVIDLGATGKGLACDEAAKILEKTDITGATISVGGSVLLYGESPVSDDGLWKVGVRDPFGSENDYCLVLAMGPGYVSTSGDYEKVLEEDGKKYHHILDPKTGYPAESNCTGVTVKAPSGVLADALSTACFIYGYGDEALALLEAYDAEAIFILKDKTIYATDGIYDSLTLANEEFTLNEVAA